MFFDNGVANPECDVHDLHNLGVSTAQNGDILIEIGTFMGEGLHCLIDKAVASGKDLRIFCADNFDLDFMNRENEWDFDLDIKPVMGLEREKRILARGYKGLLAEFYDRLREAKKERYLTGCLVGKSWDLAQTFADKSIHFCFIDAGHSYKAVKLDLKAWYPKVKDTGVFCGHDWFSGPGVRQAVIEFGRENALKITTFKSGWRLTRG